MGKKTQSSIKVSKRRSLLSTAAFVAATVLASTQVNAQDATPSHSWNYDTVLGGNVSKDTETPNITNITVLNGNGFVEGNADIYSGHTVNVTGDSGRTFAYRDNRANIETTINGNLNSNMQIVIIDKNGIFFGKDSELNVDVQTRAFAGDFEGPKGEFPANINVAGLIATTGDVAVADVMNLDQGGKLTITKVSEGGRILINSNINITDSGLAAFVAPFVQNNGVIHAKMGRVALVAGETVTLDLFGDGLFEVAVEGDLEKARLDNHGTIAAEGGTVIMSARVAKKAVDRVVNNTGIITASSATVSNGKIILSGGANGTVTNNGQVSANTVEVDAKDYVQGEVRFKPPARMERAAAIVLPPMPGRKPSITTDGGDIKVTTTGNVTILNGELNADGGNIDIDNEGTFYSARRNTLKTNGTGTITFNQNQGLVNVPGPFIRPRFGIDGFAGPQVSSIQNAVDAIDNAGTGENTINVGAGFFNEAVRVDHANTTLNGVNAGQAPDPTNPDATIVMAMNDTAFHITADNVTVDGFNIIGSKIGVHVDGGHDGEGMVYRKDKDQMGRSANGANVVNNLIFGTGSTDGQPFGRPPFGGEGSPESAAILVTNGDGAFVAGNVVNSTAKTGIRVLDSDGAFIAGNEVALSGNFGISSERNTNITVAGNTVSGAGLAGIVSFVDNGVIIDDNTVDAAQDGILVTGRAARPFLNDAQRDSTSVDFAEDRPVVISGNTVTGASNTGIQVFDVRDLGIVNNNVSESGGHGVLVAGAFNGNVEFQGNTLTNNGQERGAAYAAFHSGDIDMSDVSNPNTFINTTGEPAVAMQFDDVFGYGESGFETTARSFDGPGFGTGLRIADETLGSTSFEGFTSEESFYTRFENGSILDPLTRNPIVIDAQNASFDGVIPSSFSGSGLPEATYDAIEARLFDADDVEVNRRGQIFIGSRGLQNDAPDNFQDFFPENQFGSAPSNSANLVITGLPSVGPLGAGGLNDIAPNAGDDNGENPEDLANIDPAAGGEGEGQSASEVTCLGDAMSALGSGTVSYSFGGSFEDSIAGTSSCGSTGL